MPVLYAKIVNGVIVGSVQSDPFGSGSVSGVSGTTELTGNIDVTWDTGTSPVLSDGVTPVYANWPYDSNGVFVGNYLKGGSAYFTMNWNVQPIGFNANNIITLYEQGGSITNFIAVNPTQYTFNYQPNVTPAQIKIAAGSVNNGSLTLKNSLYSQAILTEYRPYAVSEIANYNSDRSTYSGQSVVDTAFSPAITRPYVVIPSTYTTSGSAYSIVLKLTFNNFITGTTTIPTTFTEAGVTNSTANRPYYFDGTDIISGISYSHYATGTTYPSNTATNSYGLYVNATTPQVYDWNTFVQNGTFTTATQASKIRAVTLTPGTNSRNYAGVFKFNVIKGSYVDKPNLNANVDGVPVTVGIFGQNMPISVSITSSRPTGVRYGNFTTIKFKLTHFAALLTNGIPENAYSVKRGKITKPVVDTTDSFGLTYISTYIPSTTLNDYNDEVIDTNPNTLLINKGALYTTNFGVSSPLVFGVKQSPTKYLSSSLDTNVKTASINFTVDTPIYADITTHVGATTPTAAVQLIIRDNNNNLAQLLLNTALLPTSGTTGTTTITITLPTAGLTRNTLYTVDIPTTFGINDYGTYLEDLTKTNITRTFTVDSNPISISSYSFNAPISITNTNPYIDNITFNKAILSISTSQPLVTIADKANPTVPLISIPYSTNTLAVPNAGTLGGYTDTILSSVIYNTITTGYNYNRFNTNRQLRVDKTYTLTVHTDYCTDRYSNPSNVYTSDFTLTKTDLNIVSSYLEGKLTDYDSVQVVLTAPYALYANTNNIVISLTDGTNTYTSATSAITTSISGATLTINFNLSIYKNSTNYTLTIPQGFVEDYVGNKNIAYTKSFSTIAAGVGKGQTVIAGLSTATKTATFTVPFGTTSISLVAIGGGATMPTNLTQISAGALAWINNISVTPGDIFTVTLNLAGNTVVTRNGIDLVTAQGGITGGTRSMPLFNTSLITGKIANTDYGGQAGGLGVAFGTRELHSTPGAAGGYTGYNPNPALCAHGADNIPIGDSSNAANGSSLLGTTPGGGTKYGAGGTYYYYPGGKSSKSSSTTFSETNPGAVRIIWGTGRAYPATGIADQ